jgi:hypothetical protein
MSRPTASPIGGATQTSSPPASHAGPLRRFRYGVAATLGVLWFIGTPGGFLALLWAACLAGAVVSQSTR